MGKGVSAPRDWYPEQETSLEAWEEDLNWLQAMFISELLKQSLAFFFHKPSASLRITFLLFLGIHFPLI